MAGVGFTLRRIVRQDSLGGIAEALVFSSLIAAGPWIVSIIALTAIALVIERQPTAHYLDDFRAIVTYNFQFCPILVSSFAVISTRYFADLLSKKETSGFSGLIVGGLISVFAVTLPCAAWIYFRLVSLPLETAVAATINFISLGIVWYLSIFSSAIRDYLFVCIAFIVGFTLATVLAIYSASTFGTVGMLIGLTLGLLTVAALLLSRLLGMFDAEIIRPFEFLGGFRHYPELAIGSLLFSIGTWVDKWIMWLAPEATHTSTGFVFFTGYETAMFLAGLTGIPVLGLFVLTIETGFFERCISYHSAILGHCQLSAIEPLRKNLVNHTLRSLRNYLVLQGFIVALLIFCAPRLFEIFGLKFQELGMFRFALFGNFCFLLVMFITILLSYFDARRSVCIVQSVFLALNIICTFYSLSLGRAFYGYGFFIASATSAIIGIALLAQTLRELSFHTFIRNNAQTSSRHEPVT